MDNCEKGIKRIIKVAEDAGVTICMELLNSKRDHPDYQCDHTKWGVELCKRINSPRFKLLYDARRASYGRADFRVDGDCAHAATVAAIQALPLWK